MGSDALARLWRQSAPRGPDRMVMAVLADHASHANTVAMSQRAIARLAAMPKASVAEAVNRLIRDGHIKILDAGGGHKHPSEYRLMLDGKTTAKEDDTTDAARPTKAHAEWYAEKAFGGLPKVKPAAPLVKPTMAEAMIATAQPVAPEPPERPKPPTPVFEVTDGHPRSLVGAALTALGITPAPGDLFWWRQEHKADAADLARLAGGEDALIEALRRIPTSKVPRDFRRLTALADLVKEGRR